MLKPQFILPIADELAIDMFAGGGGASMRSCLGVEGNSGKGGQEERAQGLVHM